MEFIVTYKNGTTEKIEARNIYTCERKISKKWVSIVYSDISNGQVVPGQKDLKRIPKKL